MAEKKSPYRIEHLPAAKEAVIRLADRAIAAGIYEDFIRALDMAFEQLQTRPIEWGDAEWSTRKPGGRVFHGISEPLIVKYVVFEAERYVCILNIKPLSRSPLA